MPRGDDKEAKLATFGLRLRAWWEGYSPEEYLAWLEARRAKGTTGKHKTGAATSPVTEIAWKPDRIKVANLIWGEGYCGPGGPQHVVDLSKLLGLTPDMSVLIVGGGLGGPARALAGNFGCYVTAYEQSAELAAAGTDPSPSRRAWAERRRSSISISRISSRSRGNSMPRWRRSRC